MLRGNEGGSKCQGFPSNMLNAGHFGDTQVKTSGGS